MSRRCRYLSATFFLSHETRGTKSYPADRAEATCFGNCRGKMPPRSKYKRKLHSKFLTVPVRKLFFFSVILSFFFVRASSPAVFATPPSCSCTSRAILSVPRDGIGTKKSLSVDSCPALPRELGLLQLFSPGYERNIKIHLRPQ